VDRAAGSEQGAASKYRVDIVKKDSRVVKRDVGIVEREAPGPKYD
jgi:hypothetical protein